MLKHLLIPVCVLLWLPAQAHTVMLGTEVVKGACAVLDNVEESNWLIYRQQSNVVRYVDGTVETTAIVFPTQPLPNNAPDDLMTSCARGTYQRLRDGATRDTVSEDEFKNKMNQCLVANNAAYRAELVVLRKGPVTCPPKR